MDITYAIDVDDRGESYFECYLCDLRSYHPDDIRHKYCGFCCVFHEVLVVPIDTEYAQIDERALHIRLSRKRANGARRRNHAVRRHSHSIQEMSMSRRMRAALKTLERLLGGVS